MAEEIKDGEPGPDGERVYRVREPITLLRNGKLLTGYIQTNFVVWKVLAGGLVALAGAVAALAILLNTLAVPPIRAIAKEEALAIDHKLASYQERNERHLEQLVVEAKAAHEQFVRREEFLETMLLRQKKIDEMAAQIEFLYRNEINKKRGGGG